MTEDLKQAKESAEEAHAVDLNQLRQKISAIDQQLLALLAQRRQISQDVIVYKDSQTLPLRDLKREQDVLAECLKQGQSLGLDSHYVTRVFREIIEDSIRCQQEYLQHNANQDSARKLVRVAFHGMEGSYGYFAARNHFARHGGELVFLGCPSFDQAVKSVENGQADYAVLPLENTISGGINEVYDLLLHSQVSIVGEEKFQLDYSLLALPGSSLTQIKKILCNPNDVPECSKFIYSMPECQVEYRPDAAIAAQLLKSSSDSSLAVIASEETARLFNLEILKKGISNQSGSFTRYIITGRKAESVDPRIPCKTSLVIATAQQAGSLVEALLVFKEHGIALTKLESRPLPENPWEELFYIDFEGNPDSEHVDLALKELTRRTRFIKVCGCYPAHDLVQIESKIVPTDSKVAAATPVAPIEKQKAPKAAKKSGKGYRLALRDHKSEDTIIDVRGVKIGGNNFVVMAGPCAVESYDQIVACAHEVKEQGAHILRGGCFKPRTSPYSFQGLGYEGLDYMHAAGRTYDLPIITEVLSTEDIERVAAKSDILQIGARNMQNFTLLKAVGRTRRPIMVKRGMSSTVEDLLNAVEYILAEGNQQVILCERGIRTFETSTRNTLDLSAVAVLRIQSHLPVIVDPSHAAGGRDLVPPLSRAAKAIGAQGLMIEIHPNPDKALSDGPQSLHFPEFEKLMLELL